MQVQEFLRSTNDGLNRLEYDYGIDHVIHEDGRVILNYNQINSINNKFHPFVQECRALVLDSTNNWNLVARAFPRFFNFGENADNDVKFEKCNIGFRAEHKLDGSLILVYYHNNNWHLNTRGSFGQGDINGLSWTQLFNLSVPTNFWSYLNTRFTYVFELCSRYNKVVIDYPKPTSFLLTMFDGEQEINWNIVEGEAERICVPRPKVAYINSVKHAVDYLDQQVANDKTFEGLVLVNNENVRVKVKSAEYLRLHRLKNNGNIVLDKNLIHFILAGETDELKCYFPEMTDKISDLQNRYNDLETDVLRIWNWYKDLPNRKEFALKVKDYKFSAVLFGCYTNQSNPVEYLRKNPDLVLKCLSN